MGRWASRATDVLVVVGVFLFVWQFVTGGTIAFLDGFVGLPFRMLPASIRVPILLALTLPSLAVGVRMGGWLNRQARNR